MPVPSSEGPVDSTIAPDGRELITPAISPSGDGERRTATSGEAMLYRCMSLNCVEVLLCHWCPANSNELFVKAITACKRWFGPRNVVEGNLNLMFLECQTVERMFVVREILRSGDF